jgi:hypothetical protein
MKKITMEQKVGRKYHYISMFKFGTGPWHLTATKTNRNAGHVRVQAKTVSEAFRKLAAL